MPKKTSTPSESEDGRSFEEALTRLEDVVKELEEGKGGLEDSIRLYEEGRMLVRRCTQRLDAAQKRIEQLVRTDEGYTTESMDAGDLSPNEEDESRSQGSWGNDGLPF